MQVVIIYRNQYQEMMKSFTFYLRLVYVEQ